MYCKNDICLNNCASLAAKQSIERKQPLRFDNEIFDERNTGKLESLWTQAQDFNYLKSTRTEIREIDAIGLVAVKRNEMNAI